MTFAIIKYYKILENITIFFGTDEEEEEEEEEEQEEQEEEQEAEEEGGTGRQHKESG